MFPASLYHIAPCLLLGFTHFILGAPGNLAPGFAARLFDHARAGDFQALADYADVVGPPAVGNGRGGPVKRSK